MAFGGGAPDVFASISAVSGGGENKGIEMGIAVLLGSSLFILAVVGGGVIIYAPETIRMNRNFFLRDAFFLISGLLLLLYSIAIRGNIDLTMSFIFIGLYVTYVVAVFCQDRYIQKGTVSENARRAEKAAADMAAEKEKLRGFGESAITDSKGKLSFDIENNCS